MWRRQASKITEPKKRYLKKSPISASSLEQLWMIMNSLDPIYTCIWHSLTNHTYVNRISISNTGWLNRAWYIQKHLNTICGKKKNPINLIDINLLWNNSYQVCFYLFDLRNYKNYGADNINWEIPTFRFICLQDVLFMFYSS